jgi:ribonuclease H2 subunit B
MTTEKKDIVLLIQGQLQEFNARELSLKSLPHPKGYPMLVIDLNNKLYELQCTQPRKYSSWFINQRVSSGQNIYMASILDPRFICLPYLEKAAGRFCPLDQVITMDEKYSRFCVKQAGSWKMHEMCDVNDKLGDDMLLYRYNETKLVEWLKGKVNAVAGVLKLQREAKASTHNTTFASGFNVSKQSTGVTAPAATSASAGRGVSHNTVKAINVWTA